MMTTPNAHGPFWCISRSAPPRFAPVSHRVSPRATVTGAQLTNSDPSASDYTATSVADRNAYMLTDSLPRAADWWWYCSRIRRDNDAELLYRILLDQPGLDGSTDPGAVAIESRGQIRPSYGMLNAGCWGPEPTQLHNYVASDDCSFDTHHLDVRIGDATVTESHLAGSISVSADEAASHPEWMSDHGSMSWDLTANKQLSYSVGYGADALFRTTRAFQMFWHVAGIKTEYSGEIDFNGRRFIVARDQQQVPGQELGSGLHQPVGVVELRHL